MKHEFGGLWTRTKLQALEQYLIFYTTAMKNQPFTVHYVDAFAGTGALGLEAASRGAADVVLVEQDPALARGLSAVRERLKAETVRVERGDGVAALLQRRGQGLDLVFLDPPFGDGNDELYLAALRAARQCVRDEGFIYLEAPRAWSADELAQLGLQVHREGKAGAVAFHLLRLLPAQ